MAIVGLGTDIVEIRRITEQLQRSDRLAQRLLTAEELACFQQHKFPARFLAKRFAAKEAAVKAIGTGIANGISWQQIEVYNLASGQPMLRFHGEFSRHCQRLGVTEAFISISDEQHYAVATVILQANNTGSVDGQPLAEDTHG